MPDLDSTDLHEELRILRQLRNDRLAMAQTPAEKAEATAAIVSLTKEIESLVKACVNYDIQNSTTIKKDVVENFACKLIEIITSELATIPDFEDWPRQAINITRDARSADLIKELIGEFPDRSKIMENIARRILESVAELKNGSAPDSD